MFVQDFEKKTKTQNYFYKERKKINERERSISVIMIHTMRI